MIWYSYYGLYFNPEGVVLRLMKGGHPQLLWNDGILYGYDINVLPIG